MTPSPGEQRNPYKGLEPRSWVRITFVAPDGTSQEIDLIADTGCPVNVIVDSGSRNRFKEQDEQTIVATYGTLIGATFHLTIPDIGFDRRIVGYACDSVAQDARAEHPDFAGLLGLPLLRQMEYGGDATDFWIRPAGTAP